MNKQMKIAATVLSLSLLITGCASAPEKAEAPATPAASEQAVATETEALNYEGIAEGPILVTAFGQSADVAMMKALLTKAELDFEYNPVATAEEMGEAKTIIIAAGASTKGLGAAGIKPEDELARAEAMMAAAKEKGITVIVAHLGGTARRGELSDQFIDIALADAVAIVAVAEGNEDGKFTDFGASNSIPVVLVDSISKVVEPMQTIFK